MGNTADPTTQNKEQSNSGGMGSLEGMQGGAMQFQDNRPEAIAQRQTQEAANASPQVQQLMQLQSNVNAPVQRQEIPGLGNLFGPRTQPQMSYMPGFGPQMSLIPDPLTIPVTDTEWGTIRQWRTTNLVNGVQLTEDGAANALTVARALFYDRYIRNGYKLNPTDTTQQCLTPEVVWRDPRVQQLIPLVTARGAIINWSMVTRGNRMLMLMEQLINDFNFPVNGAAGLVGNLMAESGGQPNRVEGSREATPMRSTDFEGNAQNWTPEQIEDRSYSARRGPRRPGIGLAQWTSPNRRDGLFEHEYNGEVLGVDILFNMDAQVDYLVTEMQGSYRGVYNTITNADVSVNDATDDVVYRFEVPGSVLAEGGGKRPRTDPQVQEVFAERRRLANSALAAYQAAHPPQAGAPTAGAE